MSSKNQNIGIYEGERWKQLTIDHNTENKFEIIQEEMGDYLIRK